MALSLNNIKKNHLPVDVKDGSPKKLPVMPWRDRETCENSSQKPYIKGTELEPKWSQSGAKVGTELEPKWSRDFPLQEKVEPQLEPHHEPKWSQSGAKVEPKSSISSLVGLQKKLIFFMFDASKQSRGRVTFPLSIQHISNFLETTSSATKKAIQRLEKKGVISRVEFKDGRAGWTKYELTDSIFQDLLLVESRAKAEPKWSQSGAKVGTELEPQLEPTSPSSSSINISNLKATTTGTAHAGLPPEWESIDLSPLTDLQLHIGVPQILQLYRWGSIDVKTLQDSILHFSFDLEVNKSHEKIQTDPLRFFMGILRREGVYNAPQNYESLRVRALREYLERKKRENAEVARLVSDIGIMPDQIPQ